MKRKKIKWVGKMILITISLVILLTLIFFITKLTYANTTEQLLIEYMDYLFPKL